MGQNSNLKNVQTTLPKLYTSCHGHARLSHVVHVFSYSSKYDVSEISCLGLSDMKYLKIYYRGIRLVVNFSLPKVIYYKPLLFLSCLLI